MTRLHVAVQPRYGLLDCLCRLLEPLEVRADRRARMERSALDDRAEPSSRHVSGHVRGVLGGRSV
jgi:hypothetical protein